MGAYMAIAGAVMAAGGTWMAAGEADDAFKSLEKYKDKYIPDPAKLNRDYFGELLENLHSAEKLSTDIGRGDLERTMALREQATPGITEGMRGAADALFPLLRGELPPGVLDAFSRAGGASSVGSGFGGTGFGFLNQGLFGARGSLGAMQTGFGLLPSLLNALPNSNSPSAGAFLQAIMTPMQRAQTQVQWRGQNLGLALKMADMPSSNQVWANYLSNTGSSLMGGGMTGMAGGGSPGSMFGLGGGGVGAGVGPTGSTAPSGGTITNPGYITPLP